MNKPTPATALPTPTAVPWTPDMMGQPQVNAQAAVQTSPGAPTPQGFGQQAMPPQMTQPQGFPPQPFAPMPQSAPQSYAPSQPPVPAPAPAQEFAAQHQMQPHPQPQPQVQAHPHYQAQTYGQVNPHAMPQMAPPPLMAAPPHQMPPQMNRPPFAPQEYPSVAPAAGSAAQPESKSLLAKLLKRKPKADLASPAVPPEAAAKPESLLNKNFALGALTGLVIGAVVLPMLMGVLFGEAPTAAQVQAAAQPIAPVEFVESAALTIEGETFVDNALNAETP
jgi:hypothetical protein